MPFDPTSDRWNQPCDLCGSVQYEEIAFPAGERGVRCRVCDMVTLVGTQRSNGKLPGPDRSLNAFPRLLKQARLERPRSTLLIAADDLPSDRELNRIGGQVTALLDREPIRAPGSSVVVHTTSIAGAPFLPDQFDLILCARTVESFASPSLLFEKTRHWLTTGGALLLLGLNRGSLPARLWRRSWLRMHAPGAEHLLDVDNLRDYADRYGYEVKRLRMYSRAKEVARIAGGGDASGMVSLLVEPVVVMANMLNMGDVFIATLIKEGAAVRPLPSRLKNQEEHTPGLAPALYSSAQRERS